MRGQVARIAIALVIAGVIGTVVLAWQAANDAAPLVNTANLKTPQDHCTAATRLWSKRPGFALTLSPSDPKPGDTVHVTGRGIAPGSYTITIGPPFDSGVVPIGTANVDIGNLDTTFVQPQLSGLCVIVLANPQFGDRIRSRPFIAP